MPVAHYNRDYHILRSNLLRALGLPPTIPVGMTGEWRDVKVTVGHWDDAWPSPPEHYPRKTVVLPVVRLLPSGVARRLQVEGPHCRKEMRCCALQQHVGSRACEGRLAAKSVKAAYDAGVRSRKLFESGQDPDRPILLHLEEAAAWERGWQCARDRSADARGAL